MTVREIKERAKQMGVKAAKMKKADMIRAIQAVEGNFPCFLSASNYCDQMACCWRQDCVEN